MSITMDTLVRCTTLLCSNNADELRVGTDVPFGSTIRYTYKMCDGGRIAAYKSDGSCMYEHYRAADANGGSTELGGGFAVAGECNRIVVGNTLKVYCDVHKTVSSIVYSVNSLPELIVVLMTTELVSDDLQQVINFYFEYRKTGGNGGGTSVNVENSLTSDSTTDALAALQGKILDERLKILEGAEPPMIPEVYDEVYTMGAGDTDADIPDYATIVIYPDKDPEVKDWTNYYTKPEINEIILRADFKKGKSAYEVAVEAGFKGTVEEWLASLNGYTPVKGVDYFDGYTPVKGVDYFDGYTPVKGVDYFDGKDGYTPVKGVDYFDGLRGDDGYTPVKGVDYFDGYTPVKGVDYFDGKDGYTPVKGVDYFDGYTPQRGVDYWTTSDIATIQTYVDIMVSEIVDSAPDTLDTLWELANALGNDPNFATTVATAIGKKVDKVEGKGLSSNDYTTAEKQKLAGVAENANNYTHPSTHPASIISGLATVATTGKYSDLSGKPTILVASNKGYNGAITAGGDGVAEMGKYIDFHNTANGTSDYSTRMMCTGEHGNVISLPSATGTLIVGDRALKVVITSSAPTTNDTSVMTIQL